MKSMLKAGLAAFAVLAVMAPVAEAQVSKPRLWLIGYATTSREKAILAAVTDRLKVGFDIKTDLEGDLPRQGLVMKFLTHNNTTSVAVLFTAPRPPVALYRDMTLFSCADTPASCADLIVSRVYSTSGVWFNIPAYSGEAAVPAGDFSP